MRNLSFLKNLVMAGTALAAGGALAGGFALNEASARGNALAGALVGSTGDASANYYNPANLTELDAEHLYLMSGVTLCRPQFDTVVNNASRTEQKEKMFMVPHFYLSRALTDDLYLGLGFYTEYGLGTRYKKGPTWPLAADSIESTLESFDINPNLAWRVTDRLSVAAGPRVSYMSLVNDRVLPKYASQMHLRADDWAVGYVLGASFDLCPSFSLGVVYRSKQDFEETGNIRVEPLGLHSHVRGDLHMPQSLSGGFNWKITDRLELGFNTTYTDWTCFTDMTIHFDNPALGAPIVAQKDWKSTMRYSAGLEYKLTGRWAVQCGWTHDMDPTHADHCDTTCPPGDRDQWSLGIGYDTGTWGFAVDYMMVVIHDTVRQMYGQSVEFDNIKTDTIGMSVSIKL